MIAGREFTWDDAYDQRPASFLSENLARELFGSARAAICNQITYFQPIPRHQGPFPSAIGRIESGLTVEQAQAKLDALVAELRRQYPTEYRV